MWSSPKRSATARASWSSVMAPVETSTRSAAEPAECAISTALSIASRSTKPRSTITSVSTRPDPPRRDGVVTPLLALGLAPGGLGRCPGFCRWVHGRSWSSTAARMAWRDAVMPVQRSNEAAPCAIRISVARHHRRSSLLRCIEERGAAGPVDHVRHEASDAQRIGLDRQALERDVRFAQSDARAVHDQRGGLGGSHDPSAEVGDERARRARGSGSRPSRRRLPRRAGRRPRPAPRRPRRGRAPCGRPGRRRAPPAARARRCCRRWIAPDGSNVSVFAAPTAAAIGRRLVGERERGLLVRDRDVEPAEARRAERADRLGEARGRQREPEVAPVAQPGRGERGVVHRGRARVRHGPARDPEVGQHFCAGALPPFSSRAAVVGGDVALELGVRAGEGVRTRRAWRRSRCSRSAPASRPPAARRARVADRRRRQAQAHAGVVRPVPARARTA